MVYAGLSDVIDYLFNLPSEVFIDEALVCFATEPCCQKAKLLLSGTNQHNLPDYKSLEVPGVQICTPFRGDSLFVITRQSSQHELSYPNEPYRIRLHFAVDFDNQLVRNLKSVSKGKYVGNQLPFFYYTMLEALRRGLINEFSCLPFIVEDFVMQSRVSNKTGNTPRDLPQRTFAVFQEYTTTGPQEFQSLWGHLTDDDIEGLVTKYQEQYAHECGAANALVCSAHLNPTHVQDVTVVYLLRACRALVDGTLSQQERFLKLLDVLNQGIPLLEQELILAYYLSCNEQMSRGFFSKVRSNLEALRANPNAGDLVTKFKHAIHNTAWDLYHIRLIVLLTGLDSHSRDESNEKSSVGDEIVAFHTLATLDHGLQEIISLLDYRAIVIDENGVATPLLAKGLGSIANDLGIADRFIEFLCSHKTVSHTFTSAPAVDDAIQSELRCLLREIASGASS